MLCVSDILISSEQNLLWFSFENKEKNDKESEADCQRKMEDQIAHTAPLEFGIYGENVKSCILS